MFLFFFFFFFFFFLTVEIKHSFNLFMCAVERKKPPKFWRSRQKIDGRVKILTASRASRVITFCVLRLKNKCKLPRKLSRSPLLLLRSWKSKFNSFLRTVTKILSRSTYWDYLVFGILRVFRVSSKYPTRSVNALTASACSFVSWLSYGLFKSLTASSYLILFLSADRD